MLRKLDKFQPKLITERYFPQYLVERPNLINDGQCFVWAFLGFKTFSNVQLWCTDIHAFLKHEGKFYDSETLRGTADVLSLPANFEGEAGIGYVQPHFHSEEDFKYQWMSQTFRFNTSWQQLEEKVQTELMRHAI